MKSYHVFRFKINAFAIYVKDDFLLIAKNLIYLRSLLFFNSIYAFPVHTVMKPFAELSMVKRLLEHSTVQQFRYFKVLIQEFHIKVDIIFINAIMALFEANEVNDVEEVSLEIAKNFFVLRRFHRI